MKHILFVDDEEVYSREYKRHLINHGFQVTYESTVKAALQRIRNEEKFDLFLTDLMMFPRGAYSNEAAGDGTFTGALLAIDFHKMSPQTPIIIFTAAHSTDLIGEIRKRLGQIPVLLVLQKISLSPEALADAVANLFNPRPKLNEMLKLFLYSIIMQPNVFGIGVDFKKISKMFRRK